MPEGNEEEEEEVEVTCAECFSALSFETKHPTGEDGKLYCDICQNCPVIEDGFYYCFDDDYSLCKDCNKCLKEDIKDGIEVKCPKRHIMRLNKRA